MIKIISGFIAINNSLSIVALDSIPFKVERFIAPANEIIASSVEPFPEVQYASHHESVMTFFVDSLFSFATFSSISTFRSTRFTSFVASDKFPVI